MNVYLELCGFRFSYLVMCVGSNKYSILSYRTAIYFKLLKELCFIIDKVENIISSPEKFQNARRRLKSFTQGCFFKVCMERRRAQEIFNSSKRYLYKKLESLILFRSMFTS